MQRFSAQIGAMLLVGGAGVAAIAGLWYATRALVTSLVGSGDPEGYAGGAAFVVGIAAAYGLYRTLRSWDKKLTDQEHQTVITQYLERGETNDVPRWARLEQLPHNVRVLLGVVFVVGFLAVILYILSFGPGTPALEVLLGICAVVYGVTSRIGSRQNTRDITRTMTDSDEHTNN